MKKVIMFCSTILAIVLLTGCKSKTEKEVMDSKGGISNTNERSTRLYC